MTETIGSAAGGHPDLNLSSDEKRVYGALLKEADPDGFGAVSGDVAVKFFERTQLPADVLGQIWQIADTENRGFLTPSGFGVVLRLIGHAQAGRVPSSSLAPQPAPLPRFDGGKPQPPAPAPAPAPAPLAAQMSGTPSSPSSGGPGPIRVPALSPEKVNEYSALFEKSGAENGALSGLVAKQIFERARLPNEVLGRIWNLADTQQRGFLDVTEFTIAMHMLASYKSGAMRGVPNTLPAGLYDAAARRSARVPPSPLPGQATGFGSGILPQLSGQAGKPQSPVVPQFSGYGGRPQSPVVRQQAGTPLSAQSTGEAWAVTAADKARFDQIFATVDRQGLGYINGEQAVTFFSNARLPEETLAQIWDLADINSEGRLNKDEFAVAMYLIRQQRGTRDGRGNLPSTLPPNLVPPSLRKQVIPPSHPTAPSFENATITQPRSHADDLFGLDVLSSSSLAGAQSAQTTAAQASQSSPATETGLFGIPTSPPLQPATTSTAPAAATAAAASIFKPFQPTSSFGQSIIPQSTGSPGPGQSRAVSAPNNHADLLDDTDVNVSSKLTNETAELGNLSNQIGNLSRETTELQGKRTQSEQELTQNAQQKRTFETRLLQLRTAFDKEVKEFKALQEQLTTSRNETKRLQQDIAMIEGNHADTRKQHDQLRTAYEADQQENASLKEKIRQVNVENDQLKPQIEKLKSDARQLKGMVAINRKQLSTNEQERDRLQAEITTAQKEIDEARREIEETNKQIEASKAEFEEATRKAEASKKEAEQAARNAEAARKELEETKALPKPTVPTTSTAPAPASAPAPSATDPFEATRSLPAASPPLASPAASTVSNPFMRRDGSTVFSPPVASPEPTHDHSAFDSIFGPSFGAAAAGSAPETTFHAETPAKQVVSDMQTPSIGASTPSQPIISDAVEPPAPPSARQLTSDALPLRKQTDRTESMTSSVKVIPPASRLSPADTPRAMTPSFSTPGTDKHSDAFGEAALDNEHESVRQALPRTESHEKPAEIPGAFPAGTPRSETPASSVNPTAIAVGAGAATVAAAAGLAAVVTQEESKEPETKAAGPAAETSAPQGNNFDEYFGGPAHRRTASEQVKDFDDAFASMNTHPTTNGKAKAANPEFPDIQELDDADDSSIYSEETPLGFDDDFTAKPINAPAPGTSAAEQGTAISGSVAAGKQPATASAVPGYLQPRPQLQTASSNASSLPGIEQQTSPPTYGDSVPQDNPSHFPPEFKGLLPEREDPTSPTLPTAGGSSHPGPNPSGVPPAYGPEAARSQMEALKQTRSSSAPKPAAFDDFDAAFADMGTAQVQEDDSDVDETMMGSHRQHDPEFDPSFDSPAHSRAPTAVSTQSPRTTHDAVTENAAPKPGPSTQSFFGFNDSVITSPPAATSSNNAPAISHDWDALFAPLSSPPIGDSVGSAQPVETQRTEISPEVNARTSAAEISGTSTPLQQSTVSTAPPPQSSLRAERPQPGRALSTGTEHDDPILKRLTAMGWNRTDSLAALERFDYNIDKAVDYLTFRS